MIRIFTPKHQKLVNQCFPTGRTPDKKPKSSETAYLLYYVNSRRSKLEKVSSYLIKRTSLDLRKGRLGNVCVTMNLLGQIVNHCAENLSVFIFDFLNMMNDVLKDQRCQADTFIVELIEVTFANICQHLDDTIFGGDAQFSKLFKEFTGLFFKTVTDKLHNDTLLLKGCLNISYITNMANNPQLNYLIVDGVNFTLTKFVETHTQFRTTNLEPAQPQSPTLNKRLSRTHTRPSGLADIDSTADISVTTLKAYFCTSETDKLTLSLRSLLTFLQKTPNKDLLEYISDGIPVQLRYIVILLLVRQLADNNSQTNHSTTLKLITALLLSEVSIVGLSVLDIMRKLLTFQLAHAPDQPIVAGTAHTIAALNHRTFYQEQTNDMLYELLARLRAEKDSTNKNLLQTDVTTILQAAAATTTTATTTNGVSLDLFLELAPLCSTTDLRPLFALVQDHKPPPALLGSLFQLAATLPSPQDRLFLAQSAFQRFKSTALLNGLQYYTAHDEPSPAYYLYHQHAAHYLQLDRYTALVHDRQAHHQPLSRDDLLQLYADASLNRHSQRGTQILLADSSLMNRSHSELPTREPSLATNCQAPATASTSFRQPSAGNALGRASSGDARSVDRIGQLAAPCVKDLRSAMASAAHPVSGGRSGAVRGAESLRSRVTNITFLLSELRSSGGGVADKIRDPDAEDIVGMDNVDLARSHSLRVATSHTTQQVDVDVDEFRDAPEQFELSASRGKLFNSM